MASGPLMPQKSLGTVLIVGGSGFVGACLTQLLKQRSAATKLAVVDLRPSKTPIADVDYHFGDITSYDDMTKIFATVKPNVVMHTASPHAAGKDNALFYKVNVDGTLNLLRVAQETGVRAFVFTSSASVISDSVSDLVNADEKYPYCLAPFQKEYYSETKALAEHEVLKANRPADYPKFLTCAVRPSGIFGEGDVQLLPPGLSAYYAGKTKVQIGNNDNLFDFTEVTNVAHAHHLAGAALLATAEREDSGLSLPLDTEKVDGEAFFITNDQPVYFFDFARMCWSAAGDTTSLDQVWTMPKPVGLFIATLLDWIVWILRLGEAALTIKQVKFTCMTRYYNITKAKSRLGYRPIVSLQEGVKRGVAYALKNGTVPNMPDHLRGKVPEKLQRELDEMDRQAKR